MTELTYDVVRTARGRAAHATVADYRYRFPQSARHLGGIYTVAQAAESLLHAYHLHRTCVRVIAGALIRIGPLELKIELAHHLYQHADAAAALKRRLSELRVSDKVLGKDAPQWHDAVTHALLSVDDPVAFTLTFGLTLVPALHQHLQHYASVTDSLLDQPSIRLLRLVLADLDSMRRWFGAVEDAAIEAGDDPTAWRNAAIRVDNLMTGNSSASTARYIRPHECARDDRLATFHHTRSCISGDQDTDTSNADELAAKVYELFRVQRDELDAIETFANVIYDMRPPFELELLLARLIWDEARHAEMGQQSLARLGHDPFAIPCGVIGINVRSPMPPLLALAQISIFGELNQVGTLHKVAQRCYKADEYDSGRAFDFTHADELMHVRTGRVWLQRLAQVAGSDLEALEREALSHAVRRLREEDVVGEDYANSIIGAELTALLGE